MVGVKTWLYRVKKLHRDSQGEAEQIWVFANETGKNGTGTRMEVSCSCSQEGRSTVQGWMLGTSATKPAW